ncbi:uncharacterized protein LOC142338502 isoform X2 [Convolutriloba macropyga]|uniref:uncharacterized protein LOC142338502 isoform X2 n=1 Tax=Convolutriloba macropyga TaxID=536237 RepID=UPI003F51BC1F
MDLASLEELRSKAVELEEKLASIEHSVIHFQMGASTTVNASAQLLPTVDKETMVVNKFKAVQSRVMSLRVQYTNFIRSTITTTAQQTSLENPSSQVSTPAIQNVSSLIEGMREKAERRWNRLLDLIVALEDSLWDRIQKHAKLYSSEIKSTLPKPSIILPVNLNNPCEQTASRECPSEQLPTKTMASQNETQKSVIHHLDDVTVAPSKTGQNTWMNGHLQSHSVQHQDFLKHGFNQPIGIDLMSPPKEDKSFQVNIILPAKSVYLTHAGCINITCNHCNCLIELPSQVIENLKRVSSRIESQSLKNSSTVVSEKVEPKDHSKSFGQSANEKVLVKLQIMPSENIRPDNHKTKTLGTEYGSNGQFSQSNLSSNQITPTMANSIGLDSQSYERVIEVEESTNCEAKDKSSKTPAQQNLTESRSYSQNCLYSNDSTIVQEQESAPSKSKLHKEYLKQIKSGYRNIHDVMREIDSSVKVKIEKENLVPRTAEQSMAAINSQSDSVKFGQSELETLNKADAKIIHPDFSTTVESQGNDFGKSEAVTINQSNEANRSQLKPQTHFISINQPNMDLKAETNQSIGLSGTNGESNPSYQFTSPDLKSNFEIPKTSTFSSQQKEKSFTNQIDLMITSTPRFEVQNSSEVPKQPTTSRDTNTKENHVENIDQKQLIVGQNSEHFGQNGVSENDSLLELDQLSPQEVYVSSFRVKMEQKQKTSEQAN